MNNIKPIYQLSVMDKTTLKRQHNRQFTIFIDHICTFLIYYGVIKYEQIHYKY